jgi:hypothetical protein
MSKTFFIRTEVLGSSASLEPGLAARVHDPLWMLGRQWQIGELLGDDAGSPVSVDLSAETSMLSRFLPPGQTAALDYDPTALPIELLAADSMRAAKPWTATMRVNAGRAFVRALADARVGGYATAYRETYTITPPGDATRHADPAGARLLAVAAGRLPDGEALYDAIAEPVRTGASLPASPAIGAQDLDDVRAAAQAWLSWCDETLADTGPSTWVPDRLAHQFGLATGSGAGATVIHTDQWWGSALDWHAFDVSPNLNRAGFTPLATPSTLPTGVRFRGMPNARWWEMEDASVDFGSIDAGPGDVARLALLEFGLVYANDFFAVPLRLPVGSLCRITALVVADTFGMRLAIGAASHGPRRQGAGRWSMFTLSERDPTTAAAVDVSELFFLPPVAHQVIATKPVEEVLLLRDEMANLAWAVERRYEGENGLACERVEEAMRTLPDIRSPDSGARLRYRLATTVPAHWFPLVPVAVGGDLRLRLEQMANRDASNNPRGRFLRIGASSIPDAEVPREGTRLIRDYALTRWTNGATYVWARRIRSVGRGEGSSGLRFDVAESE